MPRMSLDDKFRRDPRVLLLAKACGWSRRETMGALIDVWAVNYDRVSEYLDPVEIDLAAELDGFTEKLIAAKLGRATKRGVLITGARKRIAYLKAAKQSGRKGGIKSGESRRNSTKRPLKGPLPDPSSKTNPPDLVPDSASAVAVDTAVREGEPTPAFEISGWAPDPSDENTHAALEAKAIGVVVEYELKKFREYARTHSWKAHELDARWRSFLLKAYPTPAPLREALGRADREKSAQTARERERIEAAERKQRAEADREEVQRVAQVAPAGNVDTTGLEAWKAQRAIADAERQKKATG